MMMTSTEQKPGRLYVTEWPGGLHVLNILCLFFVVIFYVISPTIAQILAGPQSREGDSPRAYQWPIFI